MAFTLSSPDFEQDGLISKGYTCNGQDRSPALQWEDAPPGTQSFVLIVHDPDAPSGIFTHWVLFDIPAQVRRLSEWETGCGVSGMNDFDHIGYNGPCPPEGDRPHRYVFTLYALDMPSLRLTWRASRSEVEQAMQEHILEQARLIARYGRPERFVQT